MNRSSSATVPSRCANPVSSCSACPADRALPRSAGSSTSAPTWAPRRGGWTRPRTSPMPPARPSPGGPPPPRAGRRAGGPADELRRADFRPRSRLRVAAHGVPRPAVPAIDAHNHLGAAFGGAWASRPPDELLPILDEAGVEAIVDLDGGWGEALVAGDRGRP